MHAQDARLRAFLSPRALEVFSSVQYRNELWRPDPFDVEDIHREARDVFSRLLQRATSGAGRASGRLLLLLGDSGCGKTHLVRAFRALTQEEERGFLGYLQMSAGVTRHDRYLLQNLIDSLDQVYNARRPTSGLQRLSDALFARCTHSLKTLLHRPPDEVDEEDFHQLVMCAADTLLQDARFAGQDLDLLRALLYLQRKDARLKHRVLKYLRCEDLSPQDRLLLAHMVPRTHEDDPLRMVRALGALMGALDQALVLCVDQLEDSWAEGDAQAEVSFRTALQTLRDVADRTPSCVVVVCCLKDFWQAQRSRLTRPLLDRLEGDPPPVELVSQRSAAEAMSLATRRLQHLFEQEGAEVDPTNPTWPFPADGFTRLGGLRTRSVLDVCRQWREEAFRLGALPPRFPLEAPAGAGQVPRTDAPVRPSTAGPSLEQLWNDFRTSNTRAPPEEERSLLGMLGWTLATASAEVSPRRIVVQATPDGLEVSLGSDVPRLLVALCNKPVAAGALARQLKHLREKAGARLPVAVRASPFPDRPGKTTEELGALIAAGGRVVVLEDAEARVVPAFRAFREQHQGRADFAPWLREARPLTRLKAVRDVLDLDGLPPPPAVPGPVPGAAVPGPVPRGQEAGPARGQTTPARGSSPLPSRESPLHLGQTADFSARPLELSPGELTQHAAFLGGSGSGKTTLALGLVEQLLLRGVPAVLVDRKGDLAGYAREGLRGLADGDATRAARLAQLEEAVDVALFTPGHPGGRPLSIPLVPEGLEQLADFERGDATRQAAEALGGMLGYRQTGRDVQCRTALAQALDALVQLPGRGPLTLEQLIAFIESQDASLLQRVGRLDARLLGKLVQDLETLKLREEALFRAEGERLDVDMLLGRGAHAVPGKTRLSVVSTKFLGDNARVLFWVAQLLAEVGRWTARQPSRELQAIFLFDEADLYLPATSAPATKRPLEDLLRRARSAGVGLLLATQSPGDLDYKCRENIRTWFIGRVKENTALAKLRPMLSETSSELVGRIPQQETGEFFVLRAGKLDRLKATPSGLRTEQLSEEELLRLASKRP